jgi:thiol-disulfide isomerase/thioredoxin
MRTLIGRRGVLIAAATLPAGLWLGNSLAEEEMQPLSSIAAVKPPAALPELTFEALDGTPVRLSAFRGKPLVLNFWATWCAPCVAELPALDRLAASGTAVLAVSADRGGAAVVKPFLAQHGIGHAEVVLDRASDSVHAAGVAGFPTTFIIDAKGMVRGRLEGPADWSRAAGVVATLTS